jgi:hypothetical protein
MLESVLSDGEPAFDVQRKENDVVIGSRFFTRRPPGTMLELRDGRRVPFDELFYWSEAPREGTHHPDGLLWIGGGPSSQRGERVPLVAVAPTVLSLLDIEPPASMKGAILLADRCG